MDGAVVPRELYVDKAERLECCKCREPLPNESGHCLHCGGKIEGVEPVDPNKRVYRMDEFLRLNLKKEWLVKGLLHSGDCWLIKAQKKVGKSLFGQIFAHSCSLGGSFLEYYPITRPLKVAYIFSEGAKCEWKNRAKRLSTLHPFSPHNFYWIDSGSRDLTDQNSQRELMQLIKSAGVDFELIVWDCLYKFIVGQSMNDDAAVGAFNGFEERVRATFPGSASLIIHHDSEKVYTDGAGKKHASASTNNALGHTFILGHPTAYHTLMKFKDEKKVPYYELKKGECRTGDIEDKITFFISGADDEDDEDSLGFVLNHEDINRSYLLIREHIKKHGVVKVKGLREELGIPNSTFAKHRDRLIDEGKIAKEMIADRNCYVWKGGSGE